MTAALARASGVKDQAARCREVGLAIGWLHPFFLIPLSYLKFEESTEIPTMGVYTSGRVIVNPAFTAPLSDKVLAGAVCHEIMHLVLRHEDRLGGRDRWRWNIATDLAINCALRDMRIELPSGCLMPESGSSHVTAEEFYENLPKNTPPPPDGGMGPLGAGCGVEKDGEGEGGEAEGEGAAGGDGQPDWEVIAHQAAAAARGTKSWETLGKLLAPKPSAIAWCTLLRATLNRVAASGGRDIQTMTRRNRRSPDCVILPGWLSTRPTVAIAVDTSGSMSDEMLREALGEIAAIGAATGVRCFVVLHDSVCYFADWLDLKGVGASHLSRKMTHRGGTHADPAYKRIGETRARFDAMIHLTDGEIGEWPEVPSNARRLVVAFVGKYHRSTPPAAATVVEVSVGEAKP